MQINIPNAKISTRCLMNNMFDKAIDNEKQHLNLSDEAWIVIDDDIRNFYTYEDKESFSGFMNTIFINYHEEADATFSSRCEEYREELESILNNDDVISKLVEKRLKDLKETAMSYPKGTGKKFRLNVSSQEILNNHPDSSEYASRGDYLKAVYEQYTTLPTYKREQIFFKQTLDAIQTAIDTNKKIRISLLSKTNNNTISKYRYSIKPYAIRQDKTKTFNYLIGYSQLLDAHNTPITQDKLVSFRISRIDNVKPFSKSFISKDKKTDIEQTIKEKGVQFMSGNLTDIKVVFTQKGFDDFNRQSYMRPQYYEKIGKLTYVFHCTEFQARNYFFKFGMDAQILEPIDLREQIKEKYQLALDAYSL